MTGYRASTALGRVTPGETDTIWTPRTPRIGKRGVVLVHGSGAPTQFIDPTAQPSSVALAAALASAGIPCVAAEFGGDKWANTANVMAGIAAAKTLLHSTFPLSHATQICVLGVSMGGAGAIRYAQLNPSLIAGVVGIIPAYDMKYEYANISGVAAPIEAAWGFSGIGNYPAAADLATNAPSAAGIPILTGYASNDTTVPPAPVIAYHNSVGGLPDDLVNLGTLGHTDAAVGAMPTTTLGRFLARCGA